MGPAGNLSLVVRNGDHAPGTPAGLTFTGLGIFSPTLNNAGQIAFTGLLTGNGVDDTNWAGLWATDGHGDVQLIARYGDVLEVGPGDFRTIDELSAVGISGNSDGRPSAFNDRGQIAFWASFTDGSEGIFVADVAAVPESSSLLYAIVAGVLALWWGRRATLLRQRNALPSP